MTTPTPEPMTKEQLEESVQYVCFDHNDERTMVTLSDALAYSAAERVAGEVAGLERLAKAMCRYCALDWPMMKVWDSERFWHPDDTICEAQEVQRELARLRAEQEKANEHDTSRSD